MESITQKQKETGINIERILVNFKKDSKSRRSIQNVTNKLNRLEFEWNIFDTADQQLHQFADDYTDHPYFKQKYYDEIEVVYNTARNLLNDALDEIKSNDAKSEAPQPAVSEELKEKRIRSLTTLMISLERLLSTTKTKLDAVNSKAFYEQQISFINQYWADICSIHGAVIAEDEFPEKRFSELEEQFLEVIIKLHENRDRDFPAGIAPQAIASAHTAVNLPKISIPSFDGNYMMWPQFQDLFTELIHSQSLGKAQKMMYLKSTVTGEASKLIHHLSISENNYDAAWKMLQDRYNNTRLIVSAFLDKLISQPSAQTDSSSSIKSIHDVTKECLSGLTNLNIKIKDWDPFLHHILVKKLDSSTHTLYEQSLTSPRELQGLSSLLQFLERRFQSLETLGNHKHQPSAAHTKGRTSALVSTKGSQCKICNKNHPIYFCDQFLQLQPTARLNKVKAHKLCINCLKEGHKASACQSRHCSKCPGKHNTLLHQENIQPQPEAKKEPSSMAATHAISPSTNHVFLATANIQIMDNQGRPVECRAVLDSGSQLNFISERLFRKLGLSSHQEELNIAGIGSISLKSHKRANIKIHSLISDFSTRIEAFVLPAIASDQPNNYIPVKDWPIPKNIQLADKTFNIPRKIDVLIGAELFGTLLSIGQIKLGNNLPTLQNTTFGWVVLGKTTNPTSTAFCGINTVNIENQLLKFWEVEEPETPARTMTSHEQECEALFMNTTKRDHSGRYIVNLPFQQSLSSLGQSKDIAIKRFLSLERKLDSDAELKERYVAFIQEYLQLNHMEEVKFVDYNEPHYYLPHHCVVKPDSATTKLRVVFDASAKTSKNTSLNDLMFTGPTIQEDIFSILIRFRTHRYVFTGDIEKMYRQIIVDKTDQNLQLIAWRDNPLDRIRTYKLKTVTYGTRAAPYLAIKCLQTLAKDEAESYPLASAVALRDFYVDDVMTGSDNLEEARETQRQLINMLKAGGFNMHKWCANHPALLQDDQQNLRRAIHKVCPLPIEPAELPDKPDEEEELCANKDITAETTRLPRKGKGTRFLPINPLWLQNNKKEDEPSLPSKRARHTSLITIALLTLVILPIQCNKPIEIKPFENHPGIYFEDVGEVKLISSQWNLIVYYNLKTYWQELIGIKQSIEEMRKFCSTTITRGKFCQQILLQFEHQLAHIEEANDILLHKNGGDTDRYRTKRAALDIIGNIGNKLFGLLDSDYANFIEGEIEKTRANEHYLQTLINNQTSIIETTINIFKKEESHVQEQFKTINGYLKTLTDIGNEEQLFTSLCLFTMITIQNHKHTQNALWNILTDVQHGSNNALILTPKQLHEQLNLIQQSLPPTLTIPISKITGEIGIYKAMTINARIMRSSVIFNLKIPITRSEYFQLFHVTPIPFPQDKQFLFIQPSTKYLLTTLDRSQHYPLSQSELDKCNQFEENTFLCNQEHPIYYRNADINHCETALLNHKKPVSRYCHLSTTNATNFWIQLHRINTWIYALDRQYTFDVICNTFVTSVTLQGDGLLTIKPECELKQEAMSIRGHSNFKTHLKASFVPTFNVTELFPSENIHEETPKIIVKTKYAEWNTILHQAARLKIQTLPSDGLNVHHTHHYILGYLSIGIILILVIWLITRHFKTKFTPASTTPQPRPRTTIPSDDFMLHYSTARQNV